GDAGPRRACRRGGVSRAPHPSLARLHALGGAPARAASRLAGPFSALEALARDLDGLELLSDRALAALTREIDIGALLARGLARDGVEAAHAPAIERPSGAARRAQVSGRPADPERRPAPEPRSSPPRGNRAGLRPHAELRPRRVGRSTPSEVGAILARHALPGASAASTAARRPAAPLPATGAAPKPAAPAATPRLSAPHVVGASMAPSPIRSRAQRAGVSSAADTPVVATPGSGLDLASLRSFGGAPRIEVEPAAVEGGALPIAARGRI